MKKTTIIASGLCLWLVALASLGAGELEPYPADTPAPELVLSDLDGKVRNLADYRGKVVLVNFWASWCGPCVTEMPSLKRLLQELQDEAFELLLVNQGEPRFKVRKFLDLIGFPVNSLLDSKALSLKAWGGMVLPTSYILDRTGRIRFVVQGPLAWDQPEALRVLEDLLHDNEAIQSRISQQ
jgi:thiol-disulfide isomerase/thioredoxin